MTQKGRWAGTTNESRFWSRIKKLDSGCWERKAANNGCGYSYLFVDGERMYSHRYSYELHIGVIPKGMFVLHKCDNPPCVNPKHLFVGSHADNMRDCAKKGRNGAQKNPKIGVLSNRSQFTKDQVVIIRKRYAGGETQSKIGKELGVTQAAIGYIVRGDSYRDIPLEESDYRWEQQFMKV